MLTMRHALARSPDVRGRKPGRLNRIRLTRLWCAHYIRERERNLPANQVGGDRSTCASTALGGGAGSGSNRSAERAAIISCS